MNDEAGSGSRRRLGWMTAFIVIVLLLGAGTWLVVTRGLRRADLFAEALEELERGNKAKAEAHLKDLLATNDENPKARERLIRLYIDDSRYDEAAALALDWTERLQSSGLGWVYLIEVELRQARLIEAERIARDIMDRDPGLALTTVVRVRDALGSYSDRWEAQKAAVHVATVTDEPYVKASMLLFAAETVLDIMPALREGDRGAAARMARQYLAEARDTIKPLGPRDSLSEPERILRARILLLSDDEWERESGLSTLEGVAKGSSTGDDVAQVRASLAAYYSQREEWEKARDAVYQLREDAYLVWLRGARRLAARAPVEFALEVLDAGPRPDGPLVTILRAELLLRGDESSQVEASKMLMSLATRPDVHPRVLVDAYRLLAARGRREAAIAVLEAIPDSEFDADELALIGTSRVRGASDADRALREVEGLADRVNSLRESIRVLGILGRGDDGSLQRYLQAPIAVSGKEGERRRLLRAAAATLIAQRTETGERRGVLLAAASRDLGELAASSSKDVLGDAWRVALTAGHRELAGRLLGRLLLLDGVPHDQALAVLSLAAKTESADARAEVARGLRAESSEAGAFLGALAEAVALGDRRELREALRAAAEEPGSRRPALLLATQLAMLDGDSEAEQLSHELYEVWPESEHARALRGQHLLKERKYEDLRTLHAETTGVDVEAARQLAVARFELGQRVKAVDLARETVRQHPRSDRAHLLLAHLLVRADRPDQALGALAAAPSSREVVLLRARVLAKQEERWAAEALYLDLLDRDPTDLDAWRELADLLMAEARFADLERRIGATISSQLAAGDQFRGELLTLRGQAREAEHEYAGALADYEEAIQLQPENLVALNNAAWQILEAGDERRVADAQAYADRALAIQSQNPSVLDTAARAYLAAGKADEALELIDAALSGASRASYMVRRGEILIRLGREDEAESQLTRVLDEFASTLEASEATDLLRELRRP